VRAVFGLGNPGARYAATRHNVGFRVVEELAARWGGGQAFRRKPQAWVAEVRWAGDAVLLVKPRTYMNRSGEAVARLRAAVGFSARDLVVVHDDLDLVTASVRVKEGGGSGGHRGVESVIAALGSGDFLRVRVGIGRPPPGLDPVLYLLQPFTEAEEECIRPAIRRAAEAVAVSLESGPQKAMSLFNVRRRVERTREGKEKDSK
jgi:PTH1 family peptidyl-tRNA hydrolase